MPKITIGEMSYEGTPEELKEIFEMLGVKFPVEEPIEDNTLVNVVVGDYARVKSHHNYHYQDGTIVKIVGENWRGTGKYDTQNLDGSSGDIHGAHELIKVSDEEVEKAKAEAERKQAEKELEEKWAKIGRKLNEFKKGDIVRLNTHSGAHDIGTIVFVSDECGNYHDEKGEFWGGEFSWYELIAPVESRFDKGSE